MYITKWTRLRGQGHENETPELDPDSTINVVENITSVVDINANDPDANDTEGSGLTYSLSGTDESYFTIDSSTGEISFDAAPDFETPLDDDGNNDYEIIVTVTDSGNLIDTQNITVNVTDDTTELAKIDVKRLDTGETVIDDDLTPIDFGIVNITNGTSSITFEIRNRGNASLDLSSLSLPSGYLLSGTTIDNEVLLGGETTTFEVEFDPSVEQNYSGQITFDTTDPSHGQFNIEVTGEGIDNTPPDLGPDVNVTIDENTAFDSIVASFSNVDSDISDNVTFQILTGNPGGTFAFDQTNNTSANLIVADSTLLDHELYSSFTLTVRATDLEGAYDEATITISINDVDEAPEATGFNITVSETTDIGTSLGFIVGSDEDDSNSVTYSIDSTNGNNTENGNTLFAIDSSTGEFTVASSLIDLTSRIISVLVTSGSLTKTVNVVIGIDAQPVTSKLLETGTGTYQVSHTDELTFNPIDYIANPTGLTIETTANTDGEIALAFVYSGVTYTVADGEITLKYGTLRVNDDLTLTYNPDDSLKTRTVDPLTPDEDENNRVYRYSGLEDGIEIRVLRKNGTDLSLATTLDNQTIDILVTNSLPVFNDDLIHHKIDEFEHFTLSDRILTYLDSINTLDVEDLFYDPDGDELEITELKNYTSTDSDPDDLTLELDIDNNSFGENFYVTRSDDDKSSILFWNDIRDDGQGVTFNHYNFYLGIVISDGQLVEELGNPGNFINDTFELRENFWQIAETLPGTATNSVNNAVQTLQNQFVNVNQNLVDEFDRSDIAKVLAEASASWRVKGSVISASPVVNQTSEVIGGVGVDLRTGEFQLQHGLALDNSGGNSDLSSRGLIYDSSSFDSRPVITGVIERMDPADTRVPTQIEVTLSVYDHHDDSTDEVIKTFEIPQNFTEDDFVFTIEGANTFPESGTYRWELEAKVLFGTSDADPTLRSTGEFVVVANDPANSVSNFAVPPLPVFGRGWALGNIPQLIVDPRYDETVRFFGGEPETNSDSLVTRDDRFILAFPGETPRIFKSTSVNFTDFTYNSDFEAIGFDSGESAGYEFGSLKPVNNGDTIVYTTTEGIEYTFTKFSKNDKTPVWLLSEVNDPSLTSSASLVLTYETNDTLSNYGQLQSIESSDDGVTTLTYDANGFVDKITLPNGEDLDFSIDSNGNLKEIRQNAELPTGLSDPTNDVVRAFDYDTDDLLTKDSWYEGNEGFTVSSATAQRETTFTYDHATTASENGVPDSDLLSKITVGSGSDAVSYEIRPNSLNGRLEDQVGDTFISSTTDLVASVDIVDQSETLTTNHTYNRDGQKIKQEQLYNDGTSGEVSLNEESWTYNHFGDVKTYDDSQGRRTAFYYDYEIAATHNGTDSPSTRDGEYEYDPNDYRGNVVGILGSTGYTKLLYETDDEFSDSAVENPVGYLEKTVDPQGLVTNYTRDEHGQLLSTESVRNGASDSSETWEYYTAADGAKEGLLKLYISPLGLSTEYVDYDSNSRVTKIEITDGYDAQVQTQTFEYDEFGYVNEVKLYDGTSTNSSDLISQTSTINNALGQVLKTEIKSPTGTVLSRVEFEYDSDGRITAEIDGNSIRTEYKYNSAGDIVEKKEAAGAQFISEFHGGTMADKIDIEQITTYEYNDFGELTKITLPDGTEQTFDITRSALNTVQTVTTNGVAGTSTLNSDGTVSVSTSGLNTVESTFDNHGRLTREENTVTGEFTDYEYLDPRFDLPTKITTLSGTQIIRYDVNGNVVYSSEPNGTQIKTEYDEFGFIKSTENLAPYGAKWDYITDAVGNVIESIETRSTNDGTQWNTDEITTEYEFDQTGRLRKVIDELTDGLSDTNSPADEVDEVTGLALSPQTIEYSFDTTTRLTKVTNTSREGFVSTQFFDAAGRLVEEISILGAVTTYTYDLAGNRLSEIVDPVETELPSIITTYTYDGLNRVRSIDNPSGLISYIDYFLPSDTTAGWDIVTTDDKGIQTATILDSLGRTLVVNVSDHDQVTTSGEVDGSLTVLSYSNLGLGGLEITSTTALSTGPDSNASLSHTNNFGERGTNDVDIQKTINTYNDLGLLTKSQSLDVNGNLRTLTENTYDSVGKLLSSSDENGVVTKYAYSLATGTSQVRSIKRGEKSEVYFRYDSAGNLTSQSDNPEFSNTPVSSASTNKENINTYEVNSRTDYKYDVLGRRIEESTTISKTKLLPAEAGRFTGGDASKRLKSFARIS